MVFKLDVLKKGTELKSQREDFSSVRRLFMKYSGRLGMSEEN